MTRNNILKLCRNSGGPSVVCNGTGVRATATLSARLSTFQEPAAGCQALPGCLLVRRLSRCSSRGPASWRRHAAPWLRAAGGKSWLAGAHKITSFPLTARWPSEAGRGGPARGTHRKQASGTAATAATASPRVMARRMEGSNSTALAAGATETEPARMATAAAAKSLAVVSARYHQGSWTGDQCGERSAPASGSKE